MEKKVIIFSLMCLTVVFSIKAQFDILKFVEKVCKYQDSVKIVRQKDTGHLELNDFCINCYMKMFNALNVNKKNSRFNYIYLDNKSDAKPYIYVADSLFCLQEYLEKESDKLEYTNVNKENFLHLTLCNYLNDSINKACFNVVPDDNEEGYFQYLFFNEYGEQFALFWHANYRRRRIVCTENDLKNIISECIHGQSKLTSSEIDSVDCISFESDLIFEVQKKGVSPKIKMNESTCEIILYEKGKQNLMEKTYEISRTFPYKIILKKEVTLLEFISNFIF